MRISLGLPNAVPEMADGALYIKLARLAEQRGFASLGTIGRIAYPGYEELITLAAAAGATERIGLFTNVLLGPARESLLLAKQAASLDRISGGRLVLGVGVGSREDDFAVGPHDFHTRGRRWDQSLELIHRAWRGEPLPGTDRAVTVRPVKESVPMLFGGGAPQNLARIVKYGRGYTQGGGTPSGLAEMRERVTGAWREAGRAGQPEFRALLYFTSLSGDPRTRPPARPTCAIITGHTASAYGEARLRMPRRSWNASPHIKRSAVTSSSSA